MLSSTQRSQANSMRSSVESKQRYDQKSRRSSFVENLILQYKTQSNKKSTINQSSRCDQQSVNGKAGSKSKGEKYMPTKENLHVSSKAQISVQRKLFSNPTQDQHVHFPLKEMNFLQKYKSTEIKQDNLYNLSSNRMSRKGSQVKQRKVQLNNVNCDFDVQYQSQVLKNIMYSNNNHSSRERFIKKGVVLNNEKDNPIIVSDNNKRTNSKRVVNDIVSQRQQQMIKNFTNQQYQQHQLKQMCAIYDKSFRNCVQLLIQQKRQQGLNVLLTMKKGLKQLITSQFSKLKSDQIIKSIQLRQFLCLFLYDLYVRRVQSQMKQQKLQHKKLQEKILVKYRQLRQKLQVKSLLQQKNKQIIKMIDLCYMIIRVNCIINNNLFVQLIDGNNDNNSIKIELQQIISQLRSIIDIYIADDNKISEVDLITTQQWRLINDFIIMIESTVQFVRSDNNLTNGNECYYLALLCEKMYQVSVDMFGYFLKCNDTDRLLDNGKLIQQSISLKTYHYQVQLKILLIKTITKTKNILFNYLKRFIKQLTQFKIFFNKLRKCCLQKLQENIEQCLKQNKQTQFIIQKSNKKNCFSQYINYMKVSQKINTQHIIMLKILIKIISSKQTLIQQQQHQSLQNTLMSTVQVYLSIQIKRFIDNMVSMMKIQKNESNQPIKNVNYKITIKNDDYQMESYLLLALYFNRLFVVWYQVSQYKDCSLSIVENEKNQSLTPNLYKRLTILQQMKQTIETYIKQININEQKQCHYNKQFLSQIISSRLFNINTQKQFTCKLDDIMQWIDKKLLIMYYQIGQLQCCVDIVIRRVFVIKKNSSSNQFNNNKNNYYYYCQKGIQQLSTRDKQYDWSDFILNGSNNNNNYNIYELYVSWKATSLQYQLIYQYDQQTNNHQQFKQTDNKQINQQYFLSQISMIYLYELLQKLKLLILSSSYQVVNNNNSNNNNKQDGQLLFKKRKQLQMIFDNMFEEYIDYCSDSYCDKQKGLNSKIYNKTNHQLHKNQNLTSSNIINLITITKTLLQLIKLQIQLLTQINRLNNQLNNNKFNKNEINSCHFVNNVNDYHKVMQTFQNEQQDQREFQYCIGDYGDKTRSLINSMSDGDALSSVNNHQQYLNSHYSQQKSRQTNILKYETINNLLKYYKKPIQYHSNSIKSNIQKVNKLLKTINLTQYQFIQKNKYLIVIFDDLKQDYQILMSSKDQSF